MTLLRALAALLLLMGPALAQTSPVAVSPQPCAVTTVTTGGTAVTALAGPANGFMLMNPIGATESLLYSIAGAAAATNSAATFALAAGQWIVFATQLSTTAALSVNAVTSAHVFVCARW